MTQQPLRLGKKSGIKSVTLVQAGENGSVERTLLAKAKRKRVSKRWRKLEKTVRRLNKAQAVSANEYMARHERSNDKKKNGWVKDIGKNVRKAQKKGLKKVKIRII